MVLLEDIYKEHVNDLYRYMYSLSKDHYTAEDLVQEAFYRAFKVLDDYEVRSIRAWLFKVAYRAFIDHQRKNKRMIVKEEIDVEANVPSPETRVVEKESYQLLLQDLFTLKEMERQAILLADLHELSYKEAAEVLDINVNTFKSHLSRGRKKMTSRIKERRSRGEG